MKTLARLDILYFVVSFCTVKRTNSGHLLNYEDKDYPHSFTGSFSGADNPPIGSLVMLQAAPKSKYYLSWLTEVKVENGWKSYLLESIEDNTLCWWSNVALFHLSAKTVEENPQWRWTDKQFLFKDRWMKFRNRGNSCIIPMFPAFKEDGTVVLSVREKYSNEVKQSITIDNWNKRKVSELAVIYDGLEEPLIKPK